MGIVLFGVAIVATYVGIISKGRLFAYGDSANPGDWIAGLIMVAVFAFIGYSCLAFVFR